MQQVVERLRLGRVKQLGICPTPCPLLGMWIAENEGAKFWLAVLTELKNRGRQDILVACIDGLSGFPDAIATLYSKAKIQLCILTCDPQ